MARKMMQLAATTRFPARATLSAGYFRDGGSTRRYAEDPASASFGSATVSSLACFLLSFAPSSPATEAGMSASTFAMSSLSLRAKCWVRKSSSVGSKKRTKVMGGYGEAGVRAKEKKVQRDVSHWVSMIHGRGIKSWSRNNMSHPRERFRYCTAKGHHHPTGEQI